MKEPTKELYENIARAIAREFSGNEREYDERMDEYEKEKVIRVAEVAYRVISNFENNIEAKSSVVSKAERLRQIEASMKDAKPFYARER